MSLEELILLAQKANFIRNDLESKYVATHIMVAWCEVFRLGLRKKEKILLTDELLPVPGELDSRLEDRFLTISCVDIQFWRELGAILPEEINLPNGVVIRKPTPQQSTRATVPREAKLGKRTPEGS